MNWFDGFLQNKREATYQLLLVVGIVISANILAEDLILRLDLTEDNRYTLSGASRDIAESLDDPVTVTAYFSEGLPPQLSRARDEFQNFLEEFRVYSGGNLEYEFINPNESEQGEMQAQQAGIRPVTIDVRERDEISQKRAYLGAVFRYGEQREVIPVLRPGSALEYTIASTVKQLTVENKPRIGLVQGHGEPARNEMGEVFKELSQRYRVSEVGGLDTAAVPPDMEALMIIKPEQSFSQEELVAIDQYLMAGGSVLFAVDRVRTQLRRGFATPFETGIEKLLASYNVPVNADLIRDANASTIRVRRRQGGFTFVNQVRYPYIPLITNFSSHPVSEGLETVVFQFVSSIDTTQVDTAQSLTVLATSSEQSGIAEGQFNLNPMQEWNRQSFPSSFVPLAAAVEGRFTSAFADVDTVDVSLAESRETSIVVVGDGDFPVNGSGQQQQQLPEDNINLMANSIDWLADDTGLISLRTKGVTNRPLENVEQGTKTFLKYLNVFLPILFVLGYGFVRYQRRKSRRRRWREEGV